LKRRAQNRAAMMKFEGRYSPRLNHVAGGSRSAVCSGAPVVLSHF
jgi:hypothetical protein